MHQIAGMRGTVVTAQDGPSGTPRVLHRPKQHKHHDHLGAGGLRPGLPQAWSGLSVLRPLRQRIDRPVSSRFSDPFKEACIGICLFSFKEVEKDKAGAEAGSGVGGW